MQWNFVTCNLAVLLFALSLTSLPGCSAYKGPERAAVKGTVSIAGEPLKNGSISFTPTDGNTGPTAGGTITNGSFDIPKDRGPVVGMNIISINGSEKTGRKVPAPFGPDKMVDEYVEIVPPRYNTQSELKKDIQSGKNQLEFPLKSQFQEGVNLGSRRTAVSPREDGHALAVKPFGARNLRSIVGRNSKYARSYRPTLVILCIR